MSPTDRLKGGLMALARAAFSTIDYYALYSARVVRFHRFQDPDDPNLWHHRVDIKPDDDRLPGMANVPVRFGLPGATLEMEPGATVLVGWSGGDPSRPFVESWQGSAAVTHLTIRAATAEIVADRVDLGGANLPPGVSGALNGSAMELVTGMPHWMLGHASTVVNVKKS